MKKEISELLKKLPHRKIIIVAEKDGGDEFTHNSNSIEKVKKQFTKRELEKKEFRVYGKIKYFEELINDYDFDLEDIKNYIDYIYIV